MVLDTLDPSTRSAPVAPITRPEAIVLAADTLLSVLIIHKPSTIAAILLVLLLGLLIGFLCARREPVQAVGRLAICSFLVLAVAVWGYVFTGLWIDPVVPVAVCILSCLAAIQLTFAAERSERERHRALLQRFVAPQVVEELLEDVDDRLGLGGRKQQVCVLFADARDYTSFTERHEPEEVIELTNEYLTAMTNILFRHGGMLDKYTGDGLMALFRIGADESQNIQDAVRAALEMRDAAEAISRRLDAEGREPLHFGFGMHYGEAIVGLVGNPDHCNYTALGHTVIVSHRLQSIARGGELVVSEAVHAALLDSFETEAGDWVQVKGISAPIRPFRVTGSPVETAVLAQRA